MASSSERLWTTDWRWQPPRQSPSGEVLPWLRGGENASSESMRPVVLQCDSNRRGGMDVMKRALLWGVLVAVIVGLVASGFVTAGATNYKGQEIVLALDAGVMEIPFKKLAARWEAETGGRVRVVGLSTGVMYSRLMTELSEKTGAYDVIEYKPMWLADFVPYLRP